MQVNKKQGWTIRDFGPLPVPKKGDTFEINADNYNEYTFKGNWYFLGGDNVLNSRDSRYFGLVPEEYIIGIVIQ